MKNFPTKLFIGTFIVLSIYFLLLVPWVYPLLIENYMVAYPISLIIFTGLIWKLSGKEFSDWEDIRMFAYVFLYGLVIGLIAIPYLYLPEYQAPPENLKVSDSHFLYTLIQSIFPDTMHIIIYYSIFIRKRYY